VKLEYGVAMKRSRSVSTQNSKGVEFLFKKNKITYIKGTGTLAGKNTVAVKTTDGKDEKHEAKKAVIISTGSRVRGLPQAGLELNKTTIISSDEALVLDKAPKSLVIVGAGAVGCEFADVFNAFGSQVTLIDVMPNVLPLEDAAGRAPVVDGLGLKEAGVQLTDRGFIKINDRMETNVKGVYAIGDVAGPPML